MGRALRDGGGQGEELVRESDLGGAVALGHEAGLPRIHLVERLGDDGEAGAGLRLVEPYDDVALLDTVAVLDVEGADHAARRVLHFLDVAVDHELARRDDRARDLAERAPAEDDEHQDGHGREAEPEMAAK